MSNDPRFDRCRTAIVGHSAGGHLALWFVGSHRINKTSQLHSGQVQHVGGAVSLAGIADLRLAWSQKLGRGIVTRLMGGTPNEHPDRYDAGSPIELLPTGARHVLVHGTVDDTVPISQSEAFVEKGEKLGDRSTLVRLEGVGHFELIDPESAAWPAVVRAILSVFDVNRGHY
jgi:dipeptidyl aminopeptidase/acylaminoacyl peptidase